MAAEWQHAYHRQRSTSACIGKLVACLLRQC